MITFSIVDVSSIQSNVPRSNFSEEQIEQLADMILECEGVLNVILLAQTGINNYQVLAGDLEYYATVRAKEKNPRQGEMINAVITQPQNQNTLLKQAELFKNRSFSVQQEGVKVMDEISLVSGLEKQLHELRELQNRDHRETNTKFQTLSQTISSGDSQINSRLQRLENTVNHLTANLDQLITQFIIKPTVTPPPPELRNPKYDAMTVPQLKKIAKQQDIKVKSNIKKSELIAILLSQD